MNPFQRLGEKIANWWRGEPQDSGGVVTLNSPSCKKWRTESHE